MSLFKLVLSDGDVCLAHQFCCDNFDVRFEIPNACICGWSMERCSVPVDEVR